jgi:tetratricopeptide (TPR) repeat protein
MVDEKRGSAFLAVTKKVIRNAAQFGVERSGEIVLGPAWPLVKGIIAPVIEELERRFPKIFLLPEETEKAVDALAKDTVLQNLLEDGLKNLETGQMEVLAALARQDSTLQAIGAAISEGFTGSSDAFETIRIKLEEVLRRVGQPPAPGLSSGAAGLSLAEVARQAGSLQWDAQRWFEAGDAAISSDRIRQAREMLETGLARQPDDVELLNAYGFVEKTAAQVAGLRADDTAYLKTLAHAAELFARALKNDPTNAGSLNGMANVYSFHGDYDRAIQLGRLARRADPTYGAAAWDLAGSLEQKINAEGRNKEALDELVNIYRQLPVLMEKDRVAFSAADAKYVKERLRTLTRRKG